MNEDNAAVIYNISGDETINVDDNSDKQNEKNAGHVKNIL